MEKYLEKVWINSFWHLLWALVAKTRGGEMGETFFGWLFGGFSSRRLYSSPAEMWVVGGNLAEIIPLLLWSNLTPLEIVQTCRAGEKKNSMLCGGHPS